MISRCPSCGVPAPDTVRQCPGCGWDFVNNKKGIKKPDEPKKAEPPKPSKPAEPPAAAAGFSLPPARGGAAPGKPAAEAAGAPDENPFALPVARNLGPKPGESLFAPPPPPPAPALPTAKPKEAPAPEPEEAPEPAKPPVPAKPAEKAEPPPKKEPPLEEPPSIFSKLLKPSPKPVPKPPPLPEPEPEPEPVPDEPEENSAALFLPTSTKEIVVESAKRPEPKEAAAPEPKPRESAPKEKSPPTTGAAPKAPARQSTVYFAALAGGALGLLSVCVIYVMMRAEPQAAAPRPTGSSPFGKRSSGDAGLTPNLDEPELPPPPPAPAPPSPAPVTVVEAPQPTSLPAPALSRPVEPPAPTAPPPAPAPTPKAVVVAPAPAPVAPPAPAAPAKAVASRPTAVFATIAKPKPPVAPKPAAVVAAAPKKPAGPQWVFEGVVYDLLSTRGAYGVRLVFVDADDNEVASVETAEDGRYRASMKPGPAAGYALRIQHDDYSGKHIDELDSTSSVRKADLEQRKFLMQAGARSLPWIGQTGKPTRRDMALVPKQVEE